MNPELARRNLRFGWALFVLFWLIFAGTILVARLVLSSLRRLNPLRRSREILKSAASRPRRA